MNKEFEKPILELLDSTYENNNLLGVQQAIIILGWSYKELAEYIINSKKGWNYGAFKEKGFLAYKELCGNIIQFEIEDYTMNGNNENRIKYTIYVENENKNVVMYQKWHEYERYRYKRILESIGHILAIRVGVQEIDKPQIAYLDFFASAKDMQQAIYNNYDRISRLEKYLVDLGAIAAEGFPPNRAYQLINKITQETKELKIRLNAEMRKHLQTIKPTN